MEQTSGNGAGLFDAYRIKHAKILVGDLVLKLEEPPSLVLETVARTIGTDKVAEVLGLVGEIIASTGTAGSDNFLGSLVERWPRIVDAVRGGVLPLMLRQLPTALAVVLDTPANRRTVREALAEVGGQPLPEWKVEEDDDGLLVCREMRRWVVAHVTTSQIELAISEFSTMKPWGDLGKRMLAALGLTIKAPDQTGSPA